MEWYEHFNSAISFIEEHLTDDISYDELGRLALCSPYHFQRMFTYLAGLPLTEYIRRRKMSLAAVDLQGGDMKIIDVAQKYGYSSPTAFNRAFQAVHGIAPSAVKGEGAQVKTFLPITIKMTIKGVSEMNYRIENKPGFRILGVCAPMHTQIEENFATTPKLWQEVSANGTIPKLLRLMDGQPAGLLGVSACNDSDQWEYYIAVASSKLSDEFKAYEVPAETWAIFPGSGLSGLQELERRIVTEWLPTSGYEYANAPDVEVYLNPDPADAKYEVWIPVVKKKA